MMKVVVVDAFGSPGKVLRVEERPLPEPGPGQVRVKLRLSPLHNHDLMTVTGHYGFKPQLPYVPGTEALGVVDKLGEGVNNLSVGQRVTGGGSGMWRSTTSRTHSRLFPCRTASTMPPRASWSRCR